MKKGEGETTPKPNKHHRPCLSHTHCLRGEEEEEVAVVVPLLAAAEETRRHPYTPQRAQENPSPARPNPQCSPPFISARDREGLQSKGSPPAPPKFIPSGQLQRSNNACAVLGWPPPRLVARLPRPSLPGRRPWCLRPSRCRCPFPLRLSGGTPSLLECLCIS